MQARIVRHQRERNWLRVPPERGAPLLADFARSGFLAATTLLGIRKTARSSRNSLRPRLSLPQIVPPIFRQSRGRHRLVQQFLVVLVIHKQTVHLRDRDVQWLSAQELK